MTTITLDDRELATVLAALRYWQREGIMSSGMEQDIATNNGTLLALTGSRIDDLCERINAGPERFEEAEPPHEAACKAAGWMQGGGYIFHEETWAGDWKNAVSWTGTDQAPTGPNDKPALYDTWADCYTNEVEGN